MFIVEDIIMLLYFHQHIVAYAMNEQESLSGRRKSENSMFLYIIIFHHRMARVYQRNDH